MTVQEVIEYLEQHGFIADEVKDMCIEALVQVEQYSALGTVEELKEAREKQIPQTPCIEGDGYADGHLVYDTWICPNCEAYYEIDYDDYDYCPKCGQAINKSVIEGSEEDD